MNNLEVPDASCGSTESSTTSIFLSSSLLKSFDRIPLLQYLSRWIKLYHVNIHSCHFSKWKPLDPNQDLQGEKDSFMPLFQLGSKKPESSVPSNFTSLDVMDTFAISRNQLYSYRFHTGSMVFSESFARVFKAIPLLFGCLSGHCTSSFALFSDICLPKLFLLCVWRGVLVEREINYIV